MADSGSSTVFASAFRTMARKTPRLLVPLVNEAFGRSYPSDTPIVPCNSDHETGQGTRVDDSVFSLGDKLYHVECQSTPDAGMVVRMIEYDFNVAFEHMSRHDDMYEMDFPSSCVLFLRHNKNNPDALRIKVNLLDGEWFLYEAKVVKAKAFGADDIFDRELLLLLPYYLMRYEHEFQEISEDDTLTARLVVECAELRSRLAEKTVLRDDGLLYEQLVVLTVRVSDYLLGEHDDLRRKVKTAMGGEIIEFMHERAERLEREAREQGRELGIEQGRELGIEQGRDQAYADLTTQLQRLGVDNATIERAIAAARGTENASEDA